MLLVDLHPFSYQSFEYCFEKESRIEEGRIGAAASCQLQQQQQQTGVGTADNVEGVQANIANDGEQLLAVEDEIVEQQKQHSVPVASVSEPAADNNTAED
uniref:Uncharacterized protein n=1 Tax=Globodera rostochiensis TaxID=31243 RepID=A0A914HJE7_GLORO